MILADKIVRLRKQQGWSQEELADKLNVSRQAVSKWESTSSIPDLDKIIKMSALFGVSTDFLLKDDLEEIEYEDYDIENVLKISLEDADKYISVAKKAYQMIGLGVAMCITAPIFIILFATVSDQTTLIMPSEVSVVLGIVLFFFMIFIAVMIFIYYGTQLGKYEYLEKEVFDLEYGVVGVLEKRYEMISERFTKIMIFAIGLIFVGVLQLIVGSFIVNEVFIIYQVCVLLSFVACAVYLLVYHGYVKESYEILIQSGEFTKQTKENRKNNETVSSVYWLVITSIYLVWSFVTFNWHYTWIIWPIAGIIYSAIEAIMNRR